MSLNRKQRLTIRRALINYIEDLDNKQLAGQNDADSIYTEEYTDEEIERAERMLMKIEFRETSPKQCTFIVTVNGGEPFRVLKEMPDSGDFIRDQMSMRYYIQNIRRGLQKTPHDKVRVILEEDGTLPENNDNVTP